MLSIEMYSVEEKYDIINISNFCLDKLHYFIISDDKALQTAGVNDLSCLG